MGTEERVSATEPADTKLPTLDIDANHGAELSARSADFVAVKIPGIPRERSVPRWVFSFSGPL